MKGVNHRTVKLASPYGDSIPIDVKLAPLIRLFWESGIDTCQCCQEYRRGQACIEFASTADVCDFLYAVQRDYRPELEMWDEGEDGELVIAVRLLLFFPAKDIPQIVKEFTKGRARLSALDAEPERAPRGGEGKAQKSARAEGVKEGKRR